MDRPNAKPLTSLLPALRAHYPNASRLNYLKVWNAALDGRVPASQEPNGRWFYNPTDLPRIADALGLTHATV